MQGFFVNENNQLDYKGEVFEIKSEFQFLPNEKKIEMLILLINWANDEINEINKKEQ